jgi:4-amino-4-deoxy-L-arabinose transferase-like glycosyltransferase
MQNNLDNAIGKLEVAIKYFLIAASAYYLLVLFYIIANRINYPFEIEWLEGDMLLTAIRVMEGKAIYASPGLDYVPGIYPPVYYYAVAAFFKLFEPGFFAIRLVSLTGLAGVLVIVFSVIAKETRAYWLGFVGMGLFASFYSFHASWYDIARLDSFFFLLLLSGIYFSSCVNKFAWAAVVSSLLFSLAIFTKQSALIFAPFAFLYIYMNNRRDSYKFLFLLSIVSISVLAILQTTSSGWFVDYTLLRPLSFPRDPGALHLVIQDIIYGFPLLLIMSSVLVLLAVILRGRKIELTVWELMLIPAVIVYFRVRPIVGAYHNDSIYLSLWFSILIPVWLKKYALGHNISYARNLGVAILALLCVQFLLAWYSPGRWLPSSESSAKGKEIVERLRDAKGPVFVHLHPVYAWLAGKEPHLNSVNLWAYNLSEPEFKATELYDKVAGQHFSVIVLDNRSEWYSRELIDLVKKHYKPERYINYNNDRVLSTLSGFETRPESIWVPR